MATLVRSVLKKLQGFMPHMVSGPPYQLVGLSADSVEPTREQRLERYRRNEAMLANTYYYPGSQGGYKEEVLTQLFEADDEAEIIGIFNPIAPVVDAYQNIFRGRFGYDIQIEATTGGADGPPVNPALLPTGLNVIGKIWKDTNLDTQKEVMQRYAANLGTVGIRVIGRSDVDPLARRAFLQFEHPGKIFGFDEDERGNVTEIELEYEAQTGPIRDREVVKVKEVLGRNRFVKEIDGKNVLDDQEQINPLGVCPYVVLRHSDNGTSFGAHAYQGSEDTIHALNLLFSNTAQSIYDHVWPTWFGTAGGDDPTEVEAGRYRMLYTRSDPDSPPAHVEPLVAPLDFQATVNFASQILDLLVQRNPELLFSFIRALSGQSGETIAKLQTAGIQRVLAAAGRYEDAISRAFKIAMSYGILYEMWDLGTGMGEVTAAEQAFREGREDFQFRPRPVLPESIYEQLNRSKLSQADSQAKADYVARLDGVLPIREKLIQLGYKPDDADRLAKQLADEFQKGLVSKSRVGHVAGQSGQVSNIILP